jgi:hypothetical protein
LTILVVVRFGVKWSVLDPVPVTNGDNGFVPKHCSTGLRTGFAELTRPDARLAGEPLPIHWAKDSPSATDRMTAWPMSTYVNNALHEGPECVAPA